MPIIVPYTSLAPGGQQMPQLPVMQAARGQTAQAMSSVNSALNGQMSQAQSTMQSYLKNAQPLFQQQPQAQPEQQIPVVMPAQTLTGIGGRQIRLDPTAFNVSMPNIPQYPSSYSFMPSWLRSLWS